MMVQVTVSEGILEGTIEENPYGGPYFSFKGIPYAEPPVGDLRFKAPKPKQPWSGVRDAKVHGNVAPQLDMFAFPPKVKGNEDCLYLNVYTPELKPSKPLPVMVWYHGGAFMFGSGDDDLFGPQYLVKEDVILVTINYRLEVLGFLCLDTEDIPGNAAMKDMVLALQWVNKNIGSFGGDPNNITIFGESAGSMAVATLMVSPKVKGLFKRVIAQSGTALTPGVCVPHARERGLALAKHLGCQSENDKEIYEFFKTIPVEKLIAKQIPLTMLDANKKCFDINFGCVIEKEFENTEPFLTEHVCEALKKRDDTPDILLGYMAHEGTVSIVLDQDMPNLIERYDTYKELLVPRQLLSSTTLYQKFEIAKQVKEFYLKNENITQGNLIKLIDYLSFDMFGFSVVEWAKLCAHNTNRNVYLYKFTCITERNITTYFPEHPAVKTIFKGLDLAFHGDDLFYVFPSLLFTGDAKITEDTWKCIDNVIKMWTNFAKCGNPTPDNSLGVTWKPYTTREKNYLEIGNQLKPGVNVDDDVVQFWENLFRQFGGHTEKHRLNL